MKYFLGEIVVTHRNTWFGWMEFNHVLTTQLIIAEDWLEAKDKFRKYATEYMSGKKYSKYMYEIFVINAI